MQGQSRWVTAVLVLSGETARLAGDWFVEVEVRPCSRSHTLLLPCKCCYGVSDTVTLWNGYTPTFPWQ